MTKRRPPTPASGYAFRLQHPYPAMWHSTPSDAWEHELHTPETAGPVMWLGTRLIDGATMNVWLVNREYYLAQTRLA